MISLPGFVEVSSPPIPTIVPYTPPAGSTTDVVILPIAGPPGPPGSIRYTSLDPVELPNGTRTQFTTPVTYVVGTLAAYLNGLHEHFIVQDSDTTLTFSTAPIPGDVIKLELDPA